MRLRRFVALCAFCAVGILEAVCPSLAQTFSNTGTIVINDNASASPYPSSILVSGLDPTKTYDLSFVQLTGVSHTATSDIDVLLMGQDGLNTLLMSDNFGDLILNNVNLRFSDAAPITMGASGDLSSQEMAQFAGSTFDTSGFGQPRVNGGTGGFKPSNIGIGDVFLPPAPPDRIPTLRCPRFGRPERP